MKITRTAAAVTLSAALVLTLGACSADGSSEETPTTLVAEEPTGDVDASDDSTDGSDEDSRDDSTGDDSGEDASDDSDDSGDTGDFEEPADPAGVAESCQEFNTLSADLRAVEPGDSDGYDDLYLRSQDAQDAAPTQELYDVFAVLSLLALDAGLGEDTTETMETLGQAVFAAAGTCTAEDVTLTIS